MVTIPGSGFADYVMLGFFKILPKAGGSDGRPNPDLRSAIPFLRRNELAVAVKR